METAIVGILGAGFLGMLGALIHGLRSEIREIRSDMRVQREETREFRAEMRVELREFRAEMRQFRTELRELRTEMLEGFAQMGSAIADLSVRVTRIEERQKVHGALLEGMSSHGERIAHLEGSAGVGQPRPENLPQS